MEPEISPFVLLRAPTSERKKKNLKKIFFLVVLLTWTAPVALQTPSKKFSQIFFI
jgi:hypothetical protein